MSSPTADQVVLETNAIAAAEATGVAHVVKISNIPIPGLDGGLHGNHRAIEARLGASTVGATVLQPSFFSSVLLRQLELIRRGRFVMPTGAGRIAWIDPRDIAAVAAAVLGDAEPPTGALRLPVPEALDAADVAARISQITGREIALVQPPLDAWQAELRSSGMDPWLARVDRASLRGGRAARSATCLPTSSACSGVRRVHSTSGCATSWCRYFASERVASATDRLPASSRVRTPSSTVPPATRDHRRPRTSPTRRASRGRRIGGFVGADELGPTVDEVAEGERECRCRGTRRAADSRGPA